MAYAALAALTQIIDEIPNNTLFSFSVDDKQHISAMHQHSLFLQNFLENFPEKATILEKKFGQLANMASDALEGSTYPMDWDDDYADSSEYLRKAAENLNSLVMEVMEIKNSDDPVGIDLIGVTQTTSSSMVSAKDIMVGFDEDLVAIKAGLCGGWSSSKRRIVSIVGMGGSGKTTLARNAYNDQFVVEYFDIRAWVTVSQDYDAKVIASSLVASMKDFIRERYGEEDELRVYKAIKGRRYLVVMDDVWSTDACDIVRKLFPDDNNGSRIMLTTRISDVATYLDGTPPHEMTFMGPDQSWDLLRQRVFAEQDCPLELEEIGKKIARRCKGLPLAIVAIAGILSSVAKTPTSWGAIVDKIYSTGDIDEIMSLSYTHLPHYLRPCFLYLGAFQEDSDIRVSRLVKLWVAEGFLKRQNQLRTQEEEAEEYLEDLVKRNLVLVTRRKSNGRIKSCGLHDIVRDLCIRKSHEELFLMHVTREKRRGYYPRRLVITSDDLARLPKLRITKARTIMVHLQGRNYVELEVLQRVRLLRVFDSDSNVNVEVIEPRYLRYLAFEVYRTIPSATSRFKNLQSLIINASHGSRPYVVHGEYLPDGIWQMRQLRHVVFCGRLSDCPKGTARSPLQNLQSLTLVSHYSCTEETLEMIPNVKKLGICCSEYGDSDYLNNLVHLHGVEKLKLVSQDVLHLGKDGVSFPAMLRKLNLDHVFIRWEDMTVIGSLPNLQVLKLRERSYGKEGKKWETNEGEFVELEFLLIESPNLEEWITESGHFPNLKCLLLHYCHSLVEIPDDIGEIPTLELIEVMDHWRKRVENSAKRIQEEQRDLGNYSLEVRVIRPLTL